jgi:hypothetical protein
VLLLVFSLAQLPPPVRVIPLDAPLDHVQGIDTDGRLLWVSEVERRTKRALLHEFDLESGKRLRGVDLTRGIRYHPGGIAADASSIWVPVAEYRPLSSATIFRVRKSDLTAESSFEVPDHIGAIAVAGDRLIGANWDAKLFYEWPSGRTRVNPFGTRFQDMKIAAGVLVGAGRRDGEGAIEWISLADFSLLARIRAGRTDRGVVFTNEGMALHDGKLYLLPEDGPSRLFVFELGRIH